MLIIAKSYRLSLLFLSHAFKFYFILFYWLVVCGNKQRPAKWEQAKAIYLEFAKAKESVTVTRVWAETGRRAVKEWKKMTVSGGPWLEATGMGNCRWASQKWGMDTCGWSWGPYLALAGWPKLASEQKLEKLSVINQVLPVWVWWLQGLLIGPPEPVAGRSVTVYKSDLRVAPWLPGLVTVANALVSLAVCCRLWVRVLLS